MLRRIIPLCAAALMATAGPMPARAGSTPRTAARRAAGKSRANKRPSRRDLRRARRLFKRASRAYAAGRYAKAAGLFLKIHGIVGDPSLLYNAADAYEKAGMKAQALTNYQAYLAAKPDAPDRKAVEAKIAALQQPAPARAAPTASQPGASRTARPTAGPSGRPGPGPGNEGADKTPPAGPTSASPPPGPARPAQGKTSKAPSPTRDVKAAGARAARAVADEAPQEEQTEPKPRPKRRRSRLQVAAWALVGTTAVLLTAMGVFALKMEDAEDQMRRLAIMVDPYTETRLAYEGSYKSDFERYQREGKLYEKLTWAFGAAAGAAAVSAVVLFTVKALRSKKERQKVSISPLVGVKQGGLVLETRF